jgi:hypothetical protein
MMIAATIADMVMRNMYFKASSCVVCSSLVVAGGVSINSVCGMGGA